MSSLLLVCRLILSGVFLFSGFAKLRDVDGTRRAAADFGVPELFAGPVARWLPLVELALAVGLLPQATAAWSATVIGALLLLFTGAIATSIVRGKQTVCHCFGETGTTPVGWPSVLRNMVLAALAVVIAMPRDGGAGPSLLAWWNDAPPDMRPSLAVAVAALFASAALAWVCLGLLRQNGRLLLRIEALEQARPATAHVDGAAHSAPPATGAVSMPPGLPVGTMLPAFSLKDLHGRRVGNTELAALKRPVLLLFSDPNCGPCTGMRPDLERWAAQHAAQFALVVATRGAKDVNRTHYAQTAAAHVLFDADTKLAKQLSTLPTPSAIVVDAGGVIRSDVAIGQRGIEALIASLTGRVPQAANAASAAPGVGAPVPEFDLPGADGPRVRAASLRGARSLLLFWNPGCGFCQQMLPALRRWMEARPEGLPRLLVISAGSAAANAAMGLGASIGLDEQFAIGTSLGVPGTPSAVLVESDGRIASEVAVGEPAIWQLLGVMQG